MTVGRILVPTDGSKLSQKAVKEAVGLARAVGARITLLHVTAPAPYALPSDNLIFEAWSPKEYRKAVDAAAELLLREAARVAAAAKVPCETLTRNDPQPWAAIIKAARARKCDLIVMASHGRRGISGVLLGSETTKVLTHSKIPVLVCR